jgi:hypothetical protein
VQSLCQKKNQPERPRITPYFAHHENCPCPFYGPASSWRS